MASTTQERLRERIEKLRRDGDLAGADLARADLGGANLAGADLGGADLGGANLAGADLGGANLAGADLAGANLARANLARANLAGADLGGANLAGADLGGANLARADLARADLAGAELGGGLVLTGRTESFGPTPHGYYVTCLAVNSPIGYVDGWVVTAGCRVFTLAQARVHWSMPGYSCDSFTATDEENTAICEWYRRRLDLLAT